MQNFVPLVGHYLIHRIKAKRIYEKNLFYSIVIWHHMLLPSISKSRVRKCNRGVYSRRLLFKRPIVKSLKCIYLNQNLSHGAETYLTVPWNSGDS